MKKRKPVGETAARSTVLLAATFEGLPTTSWVCTVTTPNTPAGSVCAPVMKTSLAGVPTPRVSIWVALPSPAAWAVTVCATGELPLKWKPTVAEAGSKSTEVTGVTQASE